MAIGILGLCLTMSCCLAADTLKELIKSAPPAVQAQHAWMADFHDELASSDDVVFLVTAGAYWLYQRDDPERAEPSFARAAQSVKLDAPILWAIADACRKHPEWPWCAESDWEQALITADPSNAWVYLRQIEGKSYENGMGDWDTSANRAWLKRAASAAYLSSYYGHGATRIFDAALGYIDQHPVPPMDLASIEDESIREMLAEQPKSSHEMSLAWSMAIQTAWYHSMPPLQGVAGVCRAQWPDGSAQARRHCQAVARLAHQMARTMIDRSLVTALTRIRDEATGSEDYAALRPVWTWQAECQMPSWLAGPDSWVHTDKTMVRNLLVVMEQFGEIEGFRQTAIVDFGHQPEAYAIDPAQCPQPDFPDLNWAVID